MGVCTLKKSPTKTKEDCFYEPECDDTLEVVPAQNKHHIVETECKKVAAEECNPETVIKKKPVQETVCTTVPENKCETVIKQEQDNECKIVAKNVCELVDKPSTKFIQQSECGA